MLQAFIIVLREGFEAFLIVALTLAYLRRTGRARFVGAVYAGMAVGVLASALLGLLLVRGARQPLWEGIFALVAFPLVVGLVVHMWRSGPRMRGEIEHSLDHHATRASARAASAGILGSTALLISREGMETALLLFQVHEARLRTGMVLGILGALAMAWVWTRVGYALNLQRFFQVTGVFLLLFSLQIGVTALHELAEAGVLPGSGALHAATEPYGPEGYYGRWFSLLTAAVPALWLVGAWLQGERVTR